jgi:hypothetical protein
VTIRKLVFVLCRNDHWFASATCPIDGYSDEHIGRVRAAEQTLGYRVDPLSLSAILAEAGLEDTALTRLMVVETALHDDGDEPCCLVERFA